jgi:hypothetical protein
MLVGFLLCEVPSDMKTMNQDIHLTVLEREDATPTLKNFPRVKIDLCPDLCITRFGGHECTVSDTA